MYRFIITRRSANPKTGPMMVTTGEKRTCPIACPLRKEAGTDTAGACFAEHGFIGTFLWKELVRTEAGDSFKNGQIRVYGFDDLLHAIRSLPSESLWRHNQAGDLPSDDQVTINTKMVRALVDANRGRRGFTYTHFDVIRNATNRRIVAEANANGFTINLSANDLHHADQLAATKCGPVASVVGFDETANTRTPAGRKVVICPATQSTKVNCKNCGLCYTHRKAIVAFPAHGRNKARISNSSYPELPVAAGF